MVILLLYSQHFYTNLYYVEIIGLDRSHVCVLLTSLTNLSRLTEAKDQNLLTNRPVDMLSNCWYDKRT